MAENQEERSGEDLLDEPSQTKIDELRDKGQVAQSRELAAIASLLATLVVVWMMVPAMSQSIAEFMRELFSYQSWRMDLSSSDARSQLLAIILKVIAVCTLPVVFVGAVVAGFASYVQIGTIFSIEPITPSLEKIDPIKGLIRFFSLRFLKDAARVTVKALFAVSVTYVLVKREIFQLISTIWLDPVQIGTVLGEMSKRIVLPLIGVFGVFSAIDYWLQRQEWLKQVRLTKQESKEESKERDGNPQVRAKIRSMQREVSRRKMMKAVKSADAIITNPTHIAIAIKYDPLKMAAPKVVAKGADFIALKIREIAESANIPLVENVPLARTLYKTVKLNQTVPRALYQAVAEVLAYVYKLKNGI